MADLPPSRDGIRAVAFDCYGTLIDFTDQRFKETYHEICVQQSLSIEGITLWEKWMEIWRGAAGPGRGRAACPPARGARYRLVILSNADDDFLFPCLERNGLDFEVIVTSERVGFYKPHEAIFRSFAAGGGGG